MSLSEKTPRKVDEAMIDKLAEEAKQAKNLKEEIYDRSMCRSGCWMSSSCCVLQRSFISLCSSARDSMAEATTSQYIPA